MKRSPTLKESLVLSLALLLTACGSDTASSPESISPSPSASATSSSPTPKPSVTPKHTAKLICSNDAYEEVVVDAADINELEQAWASAEKLDCNWFDNYIVAMTPLEKAALAQTPYTSQDISTLYGLCVEYGEENYYSSTGEGTDDGYLSPIQAQEINGMLILCPTHPYAGAFRTALIKSAEADVAKENGTQFPDGTYLVNKDIKPGTYVVTNVENCYWERQDKNGNIIDNYVTISALRVQVKISSSDYAFFSSNCGEWKKP